MWRFLHLFIDTAKRQLGCGLFASIPKSLCVNFCFSVLCIAQLPPLMTIHQIRTHSVQQLYRKRKQQSTKPFNARGKKVIRCEMCQMATINCICSYRTGSNSKAAFLMIMHDAEVLKPSNTARLIADVIPDTFAYLWSRTDPDSEMLALINNSNYQPFVVFPKQYASEMQVVYEQQLPLTLLNEKTPLFILLDGSWREAKKMFRKSEYLANLPVLSFSPSANKNEDDGYIREAKGENQLATAQVAAKVLGLFGEPKIEQHLSLWFDVFNYQYQKSVCQPNKGKDDALGKYLHFIKQGNKNDHDGTIDD